MIRVRRHTRQLASGKTVAVRQHHREVRVTTAEDTSWWDHAGEEPVQGSPDDPEGTTYFRQGDGVLCAVHPDGTVHEVDEDESAPLTTGPEYADDPDGASVIQADGLTIGGAYACSYNPAQQVGWGHDDGGLSGESWASWGPRGLSCGHPDREAAHQAQIRVWDSATPERRSYITMCAEMREWRRLPAGRGARRGDVPAEGEPWARYPRWHGPLPAAVRRPGRRVPRTSGQRRPHPRSR